MRLANLHILVIESDRDVSEFVRLVLAYFGADVIAARTAEAALRVLRHLTPDLVLVEMSMRGNDAHWWLEQLRARKVVAPVIAISSDDVDAVALQAAGFAAVLTQPIRHDELLSAVCAASGRVDHEALQSG